MQRQATLLLATLLLGLPAMGCDKPAEPVQAKSDAPKSDAPKSDAPKSAEVALGPVEPAPAEATPAPEASTVASGLALGQRFAAFEIINCDSGDEYCQVCKFGSSPKIMAVGTIDDEGFKQDLKYLDAMVAKYGEDKIKVFAVIASNDNGKLGTPIGNKDELQAKAKALRTELGISMPVVIPAPEAGGPNGVFEDHYQVKQSRTIMFADGRNLVKYSAVAPSDYASLDEAVKAALGA
jgi:hypothetical protein